MYLGSTAGSTALTLYGLRQGLHSFRTSPSSEPPPLAPPLAPAPRDRMAMARRVALLLPLVLLLLAAALPHAAHAQLDCHGACVVA